MDARERGEERDGKPVEFGGQDGRAGRKVGNRRGRTSALLLEDRGREHAFPAFARFSRERERKREGETEPDKWVNLPISLIPVLTNARSFCSPDHSLPSSPITLLHHNAIETRIFIQINHSSTLL